MELMKRSNGKFDVRVRQGKEAVMEFDYDTKPSLIQIGEDVMALALEFKTPPPIRA